MKKIMMLTFFAVNSFVYSQAIERQIVASVGETISNTSYTLISSIGEPIIGIKGSTAIINQGFLAGLAPVTTLSITENTVNTNIKLFPNPVKKLLQISIANNQEEVKVIIYNATGQQVLTQKLTSALQTINMTALAKGMYMARLFFKNSNTSKIFKIIKN